MIMHILLPLIFCFILLIKMFIIIINLIEMLHNHVNVRVTFL
jgi:hypothetical protein